LILLTASTISLESRTLAQCTSGISSEPSTDNATPRKDMALQPMLPLQNTQVPMNTSSEQRALSPILSCTNISNISCGHDSIKITNMPSLLVKNDSLLSVLTFPGDGEIFSCMAVQEKSLAVGCSSGAVRLYDLESQTRTILDLQIPQQLTQNYSKSMVVGIGVLGSF
jgi:hypothetical protein